MPEIQVVGTLEWGASKRLEGAGWMLRQDSEVEKEFDDPGHFLASERV